MNVEPVERVPTSIEAWIVSNKNKTVINKSKKLLISSIIISSFVFLFVLTLTLTLIYTLKSKSNLNITCASNSTRIGNKCKCNIGYAGDGTTYCDECGLIYDQPNLRIVGGIPANAYSWPATSLIIFAYKKDVTIPATNTKFTIQSSSKCGGTLINRNTILSAAHCIPTTISYDYNGVTYQTSVKVTNYNPTFQSMLKIYLGAYNSSALNQTPTQAYDVAQIISYPNYDQTNELNDILILKLTSTVTLNEYIQITCLPNSTAMYPSTSNLEMEAYAAGWGTLSYLGQSPQLLYNVKLTTYNSSMCSSIYPSMTKNFQSQLCAGDYSGGHDTCQGDSGGSLYVKDTLNGKLKFITAGIISYGAGCGNAGSPGIYTRTSYFLDWIAQYT